ncbi:MAG: DUF1850 domain-containing protein [Deltaproteobacteria bacterium]|nr:DUF1850 domain-containing protein [Deltaproteobacteria bacterium]
MSHRLSLGLLIAGAAVVVVFGWPFFSVLEISDLNTGRAVLCARMRAGEEFVLAFTHSVNRRPVYDTLRAEGDRLVIVKSRFDSFGAGMPEASTDEGTLIVAPDGWLEWTVNRPVPEIIVRVGRVAEHKLNFKGREIRLADLAQPGAPLIMRVRKARMLDLVKGRCVP